MNRGHKRKAYEKYLSLLRLEGKERTDDIHVLDVGCGTGGFIEFLNRFDISCSGFDASQAQVEYAQECGLDVVLASSSTEYLFVHGGAFNRCSHVTLWDVLEHIRDPEKFLREVGELLKEEGQIFISVPSSGGHWWKMWAYRLAGKKYSFDPWEHVFFYNVESLKILLDRCGYRVIGHGVVPCYERDSLNVVEFARRVFFKILVLMPSSHPQIYLQAEKN